MGQPAVPAFTSRAGRRQSAAALATQNNVLGPIFYILFWALTAIFSRIWFVRLGYNAGVNSIKFIGDNAAYISKAAGILGVMVVGGLIPSYVSFAFPETLVISRLPRLLARS